MMSLVKFRGSDAVFIWLEVVVVDIDMLRGRPILADISVVQGTRALMQALQS